MVDGGGDGHTFRDIVDGDGTGERKTEFHSTQTSEVDGDSFREVVKTDSDRSHDTDTQQLLSL